MHQIGMFLLALTLFFVNVASYQLPPTIRSFEKEIIVNSGRFDDVHAGKFFKGADDISYAVCNTSTDSTGQVCKVTLENSPSSNAVNKKSCNVFLSKNHHTYGLLTLNASHSVLFGKLWDPKNWNRNSDDSLYFIDVTNCQVVEILLKNIERMSFAMSSENDEDYINLIYSNNKNSTMSGPDCENYLCKTTYNFNGELVNGPSKFTLKPRFYNDQWSIGVVKIRDPLTSIYYVYSFNDTKTIKFYTVRNGVATEFLSLNSTFLITKSDFNSKLSLCYSNNVTATCRQYDLEANFLMSVNFNLSDYSANHENVLILPHNLHDGSLIVSLLEFEHKFPTYRKNKIVSLKFIHVDSEHGQYSSPLEIPYENWPFNAMDLGFVESNEEICLRMITQDEASDSKTIVKYRIECL